MGSVQGMDTLPGMNSTDLSLASTVIPVFLEISNGGGGSGGLLGGLPLLGDLIKTLG